MNGTTPAGLDASVEALRWPDRRVPPIGTGQLDSLALLRFETQDAIVLAEGVLAETRALKDWMRELHGRSSAGSFAVPAISERVTAVSEAGLSNEAVERLLSALDELLGHLDGESGLRVEAEARR